MHLLLVLETKRIEMTSIQTIQLLNDVNMKPGETSWIIWRAVESWFYGAYFKGDKTVKLYYFATMQRYELLKRSQIEMWRWISLVNPKFRIRIFTCICTITAIIHSIPLSLLSFKTILYIPTFSQKRNIMTYFSRISFRKCDCLTSVCQPLLFRGEEEKIILLLFGLMNDSIEVQVRKAPP